MIPVFLKMPRQCHPSKKEAVFQLCNFLCKTSISRISDLANGEILYETIEARFPQFSKDIEVHTESSGVNIKDENPENGTNLASKDFITSIKKFIDDHYYIKSENIVSYDKCLDFDEFEIIKMAIFVLSEMIKQLLETNSEDLLTLFHFDVKFQVELEALFKLFISEREKITKIEVEKILLKSSKKVSPISTPRRTSTRHRELSESPKEDIFTNSPLKMYFESPVFKNEGAWMKEKFSLQLTLAEGEKQAEHLEDKIVKLENDLKKKDKDLKCLQKKFDVKEEENTLLLKDIVSLKAQQNSLIQELSEKNRDIDYHRLRVSDLISHIEELQNVIIKEEKPNNVKMRKSSSQLLENNILKCKDEEITQLKEKVKKLEVKCYSYRQEQAEKILAKINQKESPGARNQSYEEKWQLDELDRIEREELLSTIIVADNRDLSTKLSRAQIENKQLLKEIKNLKKLAEKNQKSGTTELKDTSKTPEIEKFRKSFNETSFILNISDDLTPHEQSSSEPEALLCSEKTSEAVLWKMYDSQKFETENTYDINLNHDSGVINDLQLINFKIDNIEQEHLLNQENNYVLGNLNFYAFLNELKKLTKNGSFQKVLHVFGKQQKEINGTNGYNRLDLQEMLKIITECVCVVVALNAESSLSNRRDKCCSTDNKELCTVIELNIELDNLKNQLTAASQKHEIDLKEYQNKVEELKKQKIKFENEYKNSDQLLSEKTRAHEEIYRKYKELILKIENQHRKNLHLRKLYDSLLDENKKQQAETYEFRKLSSNVCRKKRYYEKLHKLSEDENSKLKLEIQKLKEEIEKLLKEKEAWSVGTAAYLRDSLHSRDSCIGLPNHLNIKPEFHSNVYQESCNESILSGAFQKSITHCISENEDDYCYYNSLNPIKKEYDDERVEEIKRRNSLYPRQLQSSYPLEADLNATYHSLYMKDKCREQQHHSKKLKLGDVITEEPSLFETPISKPKKKIETPLSFQRLMKRVRCKKIPVKPK